MKKIIAIIVVILFIASCAPSPEAIQKAMEQTQMAMSTATETSAPLPTPTTIFTPTPVPFSMANIDLVPLLFQNGDLPSKYIAGEVSNDLGVLTPDKMGVQNIRQAFYEQKDGLQNELGVVYVYLYDDNKQANKTYKWFLDYFAEESFSITLDGIGEKALIFPTDRDVQSEALYTPDLLFLRCHAVAVITMRNTGLVASDYMKTNVNNNFFYNYAQRLDNRLSNEVCVQTATSNSSSDINLENIIYQSGDLPLGESVEQPIPVPDENLVERRNPGINDIHLQTSMGSIDVFLYEEQGEAEASYNIMLNYMKGDSDSEYTFQDITDIGEKATYISRTYNLKLPDGTIAGTAEWSSFLFIRCNAFAYLYFDGDTESQILNYGERLDQRLSDLLCR